MAELSAERRERLLQAVAECVAEEGIEGSSLRKVARRANATTGMTTHYYRNKDDLIVEAIRAAGMRFRASLETGGLQPGLRRFLKRFELRFRNTHKPEDLVTWKFLMEFWAASSRSEELRKHQIELTRNGKASMSQDVEQAINDGDAKPGMAAQMAADINLALFYGLGVLSILDPETYTEEQAVSIYSTAIARILNTE